MIVITAGTAEYKPIIEAQARKCAEFGYAHRIYDLGGLGLGIPYAVPNSDLLPSFNGDSLPPATFKAQLIEIALADGTEPGDVACWMDADCIPLREFMPPESRYGSRGLNLFRWDAAVTLRPAPEVGACGVAALDYLNSGVVWIRNTPTGRALCEQWGITSRELKTDQGALNETVAPEWGRAAWAQSVGTVTRAPCGARVLVLDAMEWNCWHPGRFSAARILHFKRGIRNQAVNYL